MGEDLAMANRPTRSPVLLQVRAGELVETGAWLYAWLTVPAADVLYVGCTRLPPQVRTWLHLHDPDPDVGRVAARHPAVLSSPVDVLAFPLSDGLDRQAVKSALIAALHEAGLLSMGYVGNPPNTPDAEEAVKEHVASMVINIAAHRPCSG